MRSFLSHLKGIFVQVISRLNPNLSLNIHCSNHWLKEANRFHQSQKLVQSNHTNTILLSLSLSLSLYFSWSNTLFTKVFLKNTWTFLTPFIQKSHTNTICKHISIIQHTHSNRNQKPNPHQPFTTTTNNPKIQHNNTSSKPDRSSISPLFRIQAQSPTSSTTKTNRTGVPSKDELLTLTYPAPRT